jgi:hypothetical protein
MVGTVLYRYRYLYQMEEQTSWGIPDARSPQCSDLPPNPAPWSRGALPPHILKHKRKFNGHNGCRSLSKVKNRIEESNRGYQCCGTGMFTPDPVSDFFQSRIPDEHLKKLLL